MSGRAEHVTLTGLQYPLVDGTLESDFPLGVSNHFVAPEASVTVGKGLLLVGWEVPPLEAAGAEPSTIL